MRGPQTGDDDGGARDVPLRARWGATPVLINKEIDGFIVNRILHAATQEAYRLLDAGVAGFEDIDTRSKKGLNWPMGPFRLRRLQRPGRDLQREAAHVSHHGRGALPPVAAARGQGQEPGSSAVRPARAGTRIEVSPERIHHIGVAVADLDESIQLYRSALGAELVHRAASESEGLEAALLRVGDGEVELMSALREDSPVGKFVAKRGPGLHHVAYGVDDIERGAAGRARPGSS